MNTSTPLVSALFLLTVPALAAPQGPQKQCLPSIVDAADPANCIGASTVPTPATVLPLGPEFFVAPTGEVGVGTMTPGAALDVVGDLRTSDRFATGNSASFAPSTNFEWLTDITHTIDDFSSRQSWAPIRSFVYLDPPIDQVGADARYVYSHDMIVRTAIGSDKQFEYIQGPYMLALHEGTETVNLMAGAFVGAENNHGHVNYQGGSYMISIADWEAVTEVNSAAECLSGHWGTTGWIEYDYGLYVYTPLIDAPLNNHYGIYLEDQDVGQQDSYAIYSAGGTSYLAGDLGIGTDTPAAALDVNGDFVASGTKSFVQEHPYDPTKEIRFVCLEGNEAGTYFRGRGRLVGGEFVIEVPEDFALVTDTDGLTVQLTAGGPGADLWVAERGLERIVVKGAKDVEFDYFVNGVRSGYADFETIRDRANTVTNAAANGPRNPQRQSGGTHLR